MKNSVIKSTLRLPGLKARAYSGLTLSRAYLPRLQRWGLALSNGSTWIILPIVLFFLFSYASTQEKQSESRDAEFYNNRGMAYRDKGQYDQAISDFNKALEINSKYAYAYNNRGMAYRDKGQYDQAISDYNKALEINPKYAYAYNNRGIAYGDKGQYDRA
ncbi:MAG: tetratricopeptide repeat protein, partial [Thermodesulfobacteriota bacterium]